MEAIHIKRETDGNLNVSDFGLELKINPASMFRETLHKDTREILDKMISKELVLALKAFEDSEENTKEYRNALYQKEKRSSLIYKIALIERDLVWKLHTNGEGIPMSKELAEIRIFAHSVFRYDSDYGFKSSTEIKQDIKV